MDAQDEIQKILQDLNITKEQLTEAAAEIKENPMAALGVIQKLNIPADKLQSLVGLIVSNPSLLADLASKAGVSKEVVDQVSSQFSSPTDKKDS